MQLQDLLIFAVEHKASDLHLSSGIAPMIRIDGIVRQIHSDILTNAHILNMINDIMNEHQRQTLTQDHDLDFAYEIDGVARFRINVYQQLRGVSAVFRVIPYKISSIEDIKAPPILLSLTDKPHGLILVTGPTGSGKSTTLAAMLDVINQNRRAHILTIEDPIEFIHSPKNSIINQRELKQHTNSFSTALNAALREDPDVILVGEMRDPETISLALTAAETGHLVLSSLHTNSASKAVDRIIDSFPTGDKAMVRAMLSESIQAIIAQILVPKIGGGRIGAWEILIGSNAVRNLIRENKIPQLFSSIQTGQKQGMQTMDDSLLGLVNKGLIKPEIARPLMRDSGKLPKFDT